MTTATNTRPITDIFRDLLTQLTALLRNERELAQAEIGEKIDQAARGLALMVGGAVLLIPALVVLLGAAVAAIMQTGMEPYLAALIVGAAALVIGFGLVLIGRNSLKLSRLVPARTLEQLRRDASVARHQLRQT